MKIRCKTCKGAGEIESKEIVDLCPDCEGEGKVEKVKEDLK